MYEQPAIEIVDIKRTSKDFHRGEFKRDLDSRGKPSFAYECTQCDWKSEIYRSAGFAHSELADHQERQGRVWESYKIFDPTQK